MPRRPPPSPAFYSEETEITADALEVGATGLAVGAIVVDAVAGDTDEGRAVSTGLAIGAVGTGLVAAPIVRRAGR